MNLRFLSVVMVAALCASATRVAAASAETDSVSIAVATVTGSYVDNASQQSYGTDSVARARYLQGVIEAFSINPADQPYYRGILEGQQLAARVASMKRQGLPVDMDVFLKAFETAASGRRSAMTPEQANEFMNSYMMRHQAPDTVSTASQMAFLAEKAKQRGVTVTPSGLEFEVVTEGEGPMPGKDDRVRVLYTGRLADGTVFDSTDEPVEFEVARLVPGFTEGLTMMKPGGTYRLYIPAALGYGSKGIRGVIPGNAVLDFEVRLLDIIPTGK